MRTVAPFIIAAILAMPGCTRQPKAAGPPLPLLLVFPSAGYLMPQNQPDIVCPANPVVGYGVKVRFQWKPVAGAKSYRLVAWVTGSAGVPWINVDTQETSYEKKYCNRYTTGNSVWKWRVEAFDQAGRLLTLSDTRPFQWGPCRLPGGRPCGGSMRGVMP